MAATAVLARQTHYHLSFLFFFFLFSVLPLFLLCVDAAVRVSVYCLQSRIDNLQTHTCTHPKSVCCVRLSTDLFILFCVCVCVVFSVVVVVGTVRFGSVQFCFLIYSFILICIDTIACLFVHFAVCNFSFFSLCTQYAFILYYTKIRI